MGQRIFQTKKIPILDKDGNTSYLLGISQDITERRAIGSSAAPLEQRLRDLSSKLLVAQEEERKRVAREVHDSIGSYLTGVKIRLENAMMATVEISTNELASLVEMVRHTMRESRRIMTNLRPAVLDDYRVSVSLRWLCDRFKEVYPSIRLEADINLDEDNVSEQLKVVIFRIVQEALSNAGNTVNRPWFACALTRKITGSSSGLKMKVLVLKWIRWRQWPGSHQHARGVNSPRVTF